MTDWLTKFSKHHGFPHVIDEADQKNAGILADVFLKKA